MSICTAAMRVTSTSWRLSPSRSRYLQQTKGVHTASLQARSDRASVPSSTRSYLWLLERRQTIVSDFSEFPKVTRKVAPGDENQT